MQFILYNLADHHSTVANPNNQVNLIVPYIINGFVNKYSAPPYTFIPPNNPNVLETINVLKKQKIGKKITDEQVSALMMSYELIKEIKNVNGKKS